MSCARCSSLNESEFTTEMMIHFSGPVHINNPGVLVFPTISVCLDCGSAGFNTPTKELRSLREAAAALSAAA
jgi:hypothetical protein